MSELIQAIKRLNQITGLDFKINRTFLNCDAAIYSKKLKLCILFKFLEKNKPSYQFQGECYSLKNNRLGLIKTVNKASPFSVDDVVLEFKEFFY